MVATWKMLFACLVVARAGIIPSFLKNETDTELIKNFWSMWGAPGVNIVLVSFKKHWNHADNVWARRIPQPLTTWMFHRGGLSDFILENNLIEKKTVAIIPSLEVDPREFVNVVHDKLTFHNFVQWIIASRSPACPERKKECIRALPICFKEGDINTKSYDRFHFPSVFSKRNSVANSGQDDVTSSERITFSNREITVACLVSTSYNGFNFCDLPYFTHLLDLLEMKNVSILYKFYSNLPLLWDDMYCQRADISMSNTGLYTMAVAAFTYSDVKFSYDTFYARRNQGLVMRVSDIVAKCSWVILSLTIAVATNIGLLLIAGEKPTIKDVISSFTVVWALLLAKAPPRGLEESRRASLKWIYVFWALGSMPVSIWFCGELTSSLAINIPPDNLDTLEELEKALDKGSVAPCVAKETATAQVLQDHEYHGNPLAGKLRTAFATRQEALLTKDHKRCLRCATRTDRVCFMSRMSPRQVRKVSPDIIEFRDRYMLRLAIMPVRKRFPLRDAFREFLLRVREGDLQCITERTCMASGFNNKSEPGAPALELVRFFGMYTLFLIGNVCVLLTELLVDYMWKRST